MFSIHNKNLKQTHILRNFLILYFKVIFTLISHEIILTDIDSEKVEILVEHSVIDVRENPKVWIQLFHNIAMSRMEPVLEDTLIKIYY